MPQSFSQRRRAEHARRRSEERETIAALGGDPSALVKEIRDAESSQLKELPGETFEDIFPVPEEATADERSSPVTEVATAVQARPDRATDVASSDTERTQEEQEKLVRGFMRKFQAREILPEPTVEETKADDSEKCALCRRATTRRTLGADGRKWCSGVDADTCIRIAQGRLGGATAPSRASLSGKLGADGDCRRCGKPVKWVKTQRGKKMPVDVSPAPSGVAAFELIGRIDTLAFYVSERRRAAYSGDLYESHFNTCEAGND